MTQRMILISTNHPYLRFPRKDVLRLLRVVSAGEKKRLPGLAIVCTHSRFIRTINKEFLKHDYVTDVIAFSLGKDGGVEAEIYLNMDAARNQALEYGVTYMQELRRLLIHGMLHVFGYGDANMKDRKKMVSLENKYLNLISRKARL
jgi:probable rRNA maturation factor